MMPNISYYTAEGLKKLQAELHTFKTKGRTHIAQQISDAREKGDLSENAEYDAAKEAQGMLEAKIASLSSALAHARVMDENAVDTSKVSILTQVTIKNKVNNKIMKYVLVAEKEANIKEQKISIQSPIAKGLLGKKIGETAMIKAPAGQLQFEILDIARWVF